MRVYRLIWILMVCLPWRFVAAQQPSAAGFSGMGAATEIGPYFVTATPAAPGSFDEVIDRMVEREHQLVAQLSGLRPMVENLRAEHEGRLGRLREADPGPIFSAPAGSGQRFGCDCLRRAGGIR